MITKEYRIPMPLSVEEYRIAQLYMIAKKSRIESQGEGSGVEIITNEPYSDGPGGSGQYTDKLYHIGAHLPSWLRGFLPKSLSTVREEAWNAYPYSKNKICTPYMDRFNIDIESKYLAGSSEQENVFDLDDQQLSERGVEIIDFVNEKLYSSEYKEEEDPLKFVSKKTQRGPIDEDWLTNYSRSGDDENAIKEDKSEDAPEESINAKKAEEFMCVYKICRVKFDRWPIQYKVEQFIHDYIRKTLIIAHRQAWAWQDEWHGLTMEQIREMERETQDCLAKMMNKNSSN